MLYNVYHEFSDGGSRYDIAIDELLLTKLIEAYLRGIVQIKADGRTYTIGDYVFQIYEVPDEYKNNNAKAEEYYLGYLGGIDGERVFSDSCKNVTKMFLKGREWGNLKEDVFNVYINSAGEKITKTVVEKHELISFIGEWQRAMPSGFLSGKVIPFDSFGTIAIYQIDIKHRQENNGETKRYLNQQIRLLYENKWTTTAHEEFGRDVTSTFNIGSYGSNKKIVESLTSSTRELSRPRTGKIFISHSSKDLDIVNEFIDEILILGLGLKREEIFCTSVHGTNIKSGEDFKNAIKNELVNAKAVIQVITKNYKSSEVCLNEMGSAWVVSSQVIPLIASPFNYDVGFIHASSEQLMLNNKQHLIKFYDDHKGSLFNEKINLANYIRKVEQFIEFMNRLSGETKSRTETRFFFDEVVTLRGVLRESIFQHPNQSHHRYHYVELSEPVDVLSNEVMIEEGNYKTSEIGVSKMHISQKEGEDLRMYRDKEVLITGSCWGGYTAWHQTKIMFTLENIIIAN